jgi:integrase
MLTSEVKAKFLGTIPEVQRSVASDILDKISAHESKTNKSILEFSKDDFTKLLERCVLHARNTFSSRKRFLYGFLNWLIINNYQIDRANASLKGITYEDINQDRTIEREFYRDYKSFLYTIEWAKDVITSNSEASEEAYDLPIALLYLAWEGIEADEAIQIKKEYVDLDSGIWLPISKKYIRPECETLQHLVFFKEAQQYMINGKASKTYCKSEYLLRTYLSPQIDNEQIKEIIYRFGKKIKGAIPKSFSYQRLKLSGIFYRAHNKENEECCVDDLIRSPLNPSPDSGHESRISVLSRFFDTQFKNDREATDTARSYLIWRKFYYGK